MPQRATQLGAILGRRYPRHRPLRGFSLIEVAMSSLLVGAVLVASMRVTGQALMVQRDRAHMSTAAFLAEGLLSEILLLPYMEPGLNNSPIRREAGEPANDRSKFDDVDDYHNYTESPPRSLENEELPDFVGWRRSVVVQWVNPNNLNQTQGGESGVKRVTVQVHRNGQLLATAVGIRSNAP